MPLTFAKGLTRRMLGSAASKFIILERAYPERDAGLGDDITNLRVLHPAQRIPIASPDQDAFVPIGKYYREGWFDRSNIFVCDVPDAYLDLKGGLVCTRAFKALLDVRGDDRVWDFGPFGRRKPLFVKRLRGTYSSIHYCYAGNFWHWMIDCLPKVHSLARIAPRTGVTLLMPASASEFQRETLRCVLPDNFKVDYVSGHEWLQTELFLWPSLTSERCMGILPHEYYEAIRDPIFKQYDLPKQHVKKERLYISRQGAKHRRVTNEDEVMRLLEKFGFRNVKLEEMPFRQQVELFHRADIVIGPHGAGLGATFFSGDVQIVVLYPSRVPPNYFHSMALGLGQKHHFVCHDEGWEDASFGVNIPALERVLKDELGLKS